MWPIELRFFIAEYNGLIAAPGTPKAQVMPSLSRIRTAASIARIFAMSRPRIDRVGLDAIFAITARDLNDAAFVSRDVEWSGKKDARSGGWIGHAMKCWDFWRIQTAASDIETPPGHS